MNNKRRESLQNILLEISKIISIIELEADREQDSLDNMPENLQNSDVYEKKELAVDNLNEALELLEGARDSIQEAMK